MTRPELVVICGQPFTVTTADLGVEEHGRMHGAQQRILVTTDQGFHQERDTVLHEIVHAIAELTGHEVKEGAIAGLSSALLAVLRGNPELVWWLLEKQA